jgi:S1-C subfamily serine protease
MRHRLFPLAVVACLPLLSACGSVPRYVVGDRGPQAYYQTGFPVHDTSVELERIFRSVVRLQVTGSYTTHRFALRDSITDADLHLRSTYRRATERFSFEHSKSGTAAVIGRTGSTLTLITNDHVQRLPDTLVVYYGSDPAAPANRRGRRYVESVSVLNDRRDLVLGLPEVVSFRVAARDSANDIATVTADLRGGAAADMVPLLRVPAGDASRLAWGSFVYVLGYPRGYRMVTRGIVSDPGRTRDHGFLVDGLFNRGISGGLILAVRGDTGRLEWVGMASGASAQAEHMLMPEQREIEEAGMLLPYEGRLYIERASRIDYGITFSVPMTAIQRFLAAQPRT